VKPHEKNHEVKKPDKGRGKPGGRLNQKWRSKSSNGVRRTRRRGKGLWVLPDNCTGTVCVFRPSQAPGLEETASVGGGLWRPAVGGKGGIG